MSYKKAGRGRKMEYPRKREAEEEVGKQKKLVKLAHKSDASDAEKTNAAHASWQQQPAMGAGFKFSSYVKEEHGMPLFGAQFNWWLDDEKIFAAVGSNRATIYKCCDDGSIEFLQAYEDADSDESYYTCTWSFDSETHESLLIVAGLKGIIRVLGTSTVNCKASYIGHGNSINELRIHPSNQYFLLSASKDYALRLWNLKTNVCIAIFGGVEGHRDEVLGADFSLSGDRILSCGMDHALKLWEMDTPILQQAIKDSFEYQRSSKKSFPTASIHFPSFSTRDIHRNYVDCVHWLGHLALSKSCENCVVLWEPPKEREELKEGTPPTVLHRFEVSHCDLWFIRFCVDFQHKLLVVGNTLGKLFYWDLTASDPLKMKAHHLSHHKCISPIRQVTISKDGICIVSACDNGTLWRWDRREGKKKMDSV